MIYLDVSAAVNGKAGLGRYARALADHLSPRLGKRLAFFYNRAGAQGAADLPAAHHVRQVRLGYKPWRMAVWLGQMAGIGFDRLLPDAELYHATEHLLMPLRQARTVLTVHDLIYHLLPQHHKRLNYWFLNAAMPLFCRRADALIAISENSKRDLVRLYGVAPAKVHVIYEAAAPHFCAQTPPRVAAVRARYHLPADYMLAVGTIEPRKNLERLLDALLILRRGGLDAHLVIVGSKGWLTEGFFAKLESLPERDAVHLTGYVADEDLPALYAGARLTVLASVYEGFGLPILEGMACGSPVVCSQTSSLPELGGTAARYFDPRNVEAMAQTLQQVWLDEEQQTAMRQAGFARAAQFSWAQTAASTQTVYGAVMGARAGENSGTRK
ncbi:glycosyltransferase family 4 protein [Candidatus Amarolinea aalborgensis]|uniref:glycosyltransferase family 4 protein n=1 Tax=Candidatus Amarolinea aalborgensis TaxID=2249329 RepID=UPI003BF96F22